MQHSPSPATFSVRLLCSALLAAAFLAPSPLSARTSGDAAHGLIYVSDTFAPTGNGPGVVYVFPQAGIDPQPIAQIRAGVDLPQGLAVDTNGVLYVSNKGDDTVKAYRPGQLRPSKTFRIPAPYVDVDDVAVGPDGTVYAAGVSGDGFIVEFPKGSTQPGLVIHMSTTAVAVDGSNNLYAISDTRPGQVYVFPPGSSTGTSLNVTIGLSRGLAIDARHDVVVSDLDNGAIEIFPPGAHQPSRVLTRGIVRTYRLAFNAKGDRLYLPTAFDQPFGQRIVIGLDYPSGRIFSAFFFLNPVIVTGYPYGIALSPAASF